MSVVLRTLAGMSRDEVDARVGDVLAALDDRDWRVRHEASLALARGSARDLVVEALLDRVVGSDIEARNAALGALGLLGATVTAAALRRLALTQGPARRFVVEALREADLSTCVAELAALVADADVNVAAAATETLALARAADADAALAVALDHRDPVVRLAALLAFERRPDAVPVARVADLVDDPVCARAAVRALAAARDPGAVDHLVARLDDPRATVVAEALQGIADGAWRRSPTGVSSERASLPPVVARATVLRVAALAGAAERPATRAAALALLGRIGDPATRPVVLAGCEDADRVVASAAYAALEGYALDAAALREAAVAGEGALAAALALLRARGLGADAARCAEALVALVSADRAAPVAFAVLAARGGAEASGRCLDLLRERVARGGDIVAWLPAIESLASDPVAREALGAMVRPGADGVVIAAALAPWGFTGDDAVARRGMVDDDPRVRQLAVRVAAALGEAGMEIGRGALADDDARVRAEAADACCARCVDADALVALALDASAPGAVRRRAVELAAFRATPDPAVLRRLLGDPDVEVARAALGVGGPWLDADALEALVSVDDPTLAAEALSTLRELDGARAAARALVALDHPAWELRWEAARGLDGADPTVRAALVARLDREEHPAVREVLAARLGLDLGVG